MRMELSVFLLSIKKLHCEDEVKDTRMKMGKRGGGRRKEIREKIKDTCRTKGEEVFENLSLCSSTEDKKKSNTSFSSSLLCFPLPWKTKDNSQHFFISLFLHLSHSHLSIHIIVYIF